MIWRYCSSWMSIYQFVSWVQCCWTGVTRCGQCKSASRIRQSLLQPTSRGRSSSQQTPGFSRNSSGIQRTIPAVFTEPGLFRFRENGILPALASSSTCLSLRHSTQDDALSQIHDSVLTVPSALFALPRTDSRAGIGGGLHCGEVDFAHLQHGLHSTTSPAWIGIAEQIGQLDRDDLPADSKPVL